jgi:hypothetical protein
MKIEILYVPGCPNFQPAADAVAHILESESLHVEVRPVLVQTETEAAALRFPGSPTIRVNGNDVESERPNAVGLSCRLYKNRSGVPDEKALRRAISAARGKE